MKIDWLAVLLKSEVKRSLQSLVYSVSPLWLEHNQIRLLQLQPGHTKSPIKCLIFRADLNSAPEYEALSYTWGSPNNPGLIFLNEHPFRVTKNLFRALRDLRSERDPRMVWIDALCINQEDVAERSEQVQQMTEIYQRAWRVLVWLGSHVSHEIQAAVKVFQSWPSSRQFSVCGKEIIGPTLGQDSAQLGYSPYMTNMQLQGLLEILQRPWWKRAWVVQEVTVAKKVIIGCGPTSGDESAWFSWDTLLDIEGHFMRAMMDNLEGDVINFARATMQLGSMKGLRDYAMYNGPQCLQLESLLRLGHDFDTTNPADKVFALLGLAKDRNSLGMRPDYSKTPQDVYMDATRAICTASQSLDILTLDIKSNLLGLPTWARDFSAPFESHVMWNGGVATLADLKYSASGDRPATLRPSRMKEQLCVDGRQLDRVKQVAPIQLKLLSYDSHVKAETESPTNARDSHHIPRGDSLPQPLIHFHLEVQNFATLYNMLKDTEDKSSTEDVQHLSEKLWLILSGQRDLFFDEALDLDSAADTYRFGVWKGCDVPVGHPISMIHPSRFNHTRELFEMQAGTLCPPLRTSLGRSFFVTENGYVGLCPITTKPGNLIAVLFGASIPLVLGEHAEDNTYSVIGGCFVQGFMSGEVLDLDSAPESFTLC